MTKVIHLQTHLPSSGNAAFRLHSALRQAGVDSSILSLTSDLPDHEYTRHLGRGSKATARANSLLQGFLTRKADSKLGYFSYPVLGTDISKLDEVRKADIIYLHWAIGGFLNLSNMEQLAQLGKPLIVFMHDMWYITGGCHYSFSCDKFKANCSNCPIMPANQFKDLAASAFEQKKRLFSQYQNLVFVSPSHWLYTLAKASALTRDKPVYHIPNILNTSIFKPIDKQAARQLLNIPAQDKVLCFGAASVDSPYKGWQYLLDALYLLKERQPDETISVLIFGSANRKELEASIPFRTTFLGRLHDDYSTALAYNAADVFVAPSLADNLPTTVMESLACGTAVVGFDTGGIPDMVQHKQNGYLATYRDTSDLARGISYCLDEQVKGSLLDKFNPALLVETHFELYKKMLTEAQ